MEQTWNWSVVLPPGWASVPTDAEGGRRKIKAVLDRALAQQPRDSVAVARRAIEAELAERLGVARQAGAQAVHVQVETTGGAPVSSCLTGVVLTLIEDTSAQEAVLQRLFGAESDVEELSSVELAGLPTLRRQRRRVAPLAPGAPDVVETAVDFVVDLPDSDDVLALTFSTQTDELREPLIALFDAMAGTLDVSRA